MLFSVSSVIAGESIVCDDAVALVMGDRVPLEMSGGLDVCEESCHTLGDTTGNCMWERRGTL